MIKGNVQTEALAGFLNGNRHLLHKGFIKLGVIVDKVAYTETAAQIQLLDFIGKFLLDLCHKSKHNLGRRLEGVNFENLRADVTMNALKGDIFLLEDFLYRLKGLAGFKSKSEFAVDLAGSDKHWV